MSFAGWTLFYQVALALQFSMLWAGWPWILLTGVIAVACGLRELGDHRDLGDHSRQSETPLPPALPRWALLGGGVLLVLLVAGRNWMGVWPAAVVALVLLVAQIWPWRHVRQSNAATTELVHSDQQPSQPAHLFALAASIAFGLLGSFLLRPDADDVFYVNRATWVATHGTAALNDTMFGPNTQPLATSAGIPTPSVEAAQGVIAHALGVQAPTFCYLLLVPLLGALAGWTTWRLIRQWARRRWALAMAASTLFLLTSAESIVGFYSLGRIWQGKATAYLILLPLAWLFLSRTTSRRRTWDLVMLAAAGVAFVGLTTSSSFMAPMVAGSALLAALILRSRSLVAGALAFLAAPAVNGAVQVLSPVAIGGDGDSPTVAADGAFEIGFGVSTPLALFGVAAAVLTPRLVRGRAGVVLGCGAGATMAALIPGVFELADLATGAGPVMWRLVIVLPIWVLIGLLTTVRDLPRGERARQTGRIETAASGCLIALVFVVPIVFGSWLWHGEGAQLSRRPTWKVDQSALADVRAARKRDIPGGRWLLPPDQMQILAVATIEPSAVVPRAYYLGNLDVTTQELSDRVALYRLVSGLPVPTRTIRGAIDRLDVSLACVGEEDRLAQRLLSQAVGEQLTRIGRMRCHVRHAD